MNNKLGGPRQERAAVFIDRLERRAMLSSGVVNIGGVQAAALDQPQIHAILQTSPGGTPLMGQDVIGDPTYDIQGFLDTGTSGVLLSSDVASTFGVAESTYNGQTVTYNDTGVAGGEGFGVSSPFTVSLAPFSVNDDVNLGGPPPDLSAYNQSFNNLRLQISRDAVDPLLGPLNIFGMPTLQGKVMVMDPTPVNQLSEMSTYVYSPGTPYNASKASTAPGIPTTNYHVKVSYGSFLQFTTTTPTGAPVPAELANPFIGPNPVAKFNGTSAGTTPPVMLDEGLHTSTGSFLFDTGAAASFISRAEATKLGVHYQAGTYNTDNPVLVDGNNKVLPNQFVIPLGGIGGSLNAAGFYLTSLTLPTSEGPGIRFLKAPVLVADVAVADPKTKKSLTLDGDFGMNFLVASTDINGNASSAGAFRWVTFDQPHGILGLQLNGAKVTPLPTAAAALTNVISPATNYTFKVTYKAYTGGNMLASSIDNSDIKVTGPNGFSKLATKVSITPTTNANTITATYHITAPGTGWSSTTNGTYTVKVQSDQVCDTTYSYVSAATLGTFTVTVPVATAVVATNFSTTAIVDASPAAMTFGDLVGENSSSDQRVVVGADAILRESSRRGTAKSSESSS